MKAKDQHLAFVSFHNMHAVLQRIRLASFEDVYIEMAWKWPYIKKRSVG